MNHKIRTTIISLAAATTLALAGCGAYDEGQAASQASNAAPDSTSAALTTLVASETWAKAIDAGMTSAFGTIKNPTGQDITVTGVSSPASKTAELHETVMDADGTMKMQAKQGGFTVPAHGELVLEPGAGHIMLMDLVKPVAAGDDIILTLELGNGQELAFTAQVKDFSGANESYGDIEGADTDHGGMDHSGMDHSGMDHGTETDTPADHK